MTAAFPVAPAEVNPPIVNPPQPPYGFVWANPQHLQLPYTFQWNASLEQALGRFQSLTISYVGANGRKLLEQSDISASQINPQFGGSLYLIKNGLTSSYNSLQVKVQRQISHGLQALASYTWSHALDFGSFNAALPYQRGNSDQDVRNNLSAAASYDFSPALHSSSRAILNGWGLDGRFTARSAFPVTLNGYTVTRSRNWPSLQRWLEPRSQYAALCRWVAISWCQEHQSGGICIPCGKSGRRRAAKFRSGFRRCATGLCVPS